MKRYGMLEIMLSKLTEPISITVTIIDIQFEQKTELLLI